MINKEVVLYQVTIKDTTGYIWKFKTHKRPVLVPDREFVDIILNGGAITQFNRHYIVSFSTKPISGRYSYGYNDGDEIEEPKVEEELHFPNTEPDLDELNRQMKIEEIVDAKD